MPASPEGGSPPRQWVFLRGLTREAGHWGTFRATFEAAFPNETIHTLDLPGCGLARDGGSPMSIPAVMKAVRRNCVPAAASGNLHVLALSMGVMVTLAWMRHFPGEIERAVLINGSHGRLSPPWRRLQPIAARDLGLVALTRDVERRERLIFALTSARPPLAHNVIPTWAELARTRPMLPMDAARQLVAAARYREPLPAAPPPTLVLAGREDRLVHPSCSHALAGALGAVVSEHPTAGHDLPLDEPDWVVQQVQEWLAGS